MSVWAEAVLIVCAVALSVALVLLILSVRGLTARADRVLGIVEEELRPLADEVRELTSEVRSLTRQARAELTELGTVTQRLGTVVGGVGNLVALVGGMTRAGQLVNLALGLKRGVDVFVHRLRKGAHHG